jgi:phosphoribosylanthranilate isomerase
MTWVKICGITNLEDALVATEAGADALGFVFYDKSPRNVQPRVVRSIVSKLPQHTEKVGVFVGDTVDRRIIRQANLTAVQSHSEPTSPHWPPLVKLGDLSKKVFYAFSAEQISTGGFGGFSWRQGAKDVVDAIMIDSGNCDKPGGTGKPFNWEDTARSASEIGRDFNVIVAGGLTPENVADAMRILHPWGVDVSSGVEARPGKKDPEKIRAFIQAVRAADNGSSN